VNVLHDLNSDLDGLTASAKHFYLSIPLGQLSAMQLSALASAIEKYLKQKYIEISPNLNIKFDESVLHYRQALFDHFIIYGLFIIDKDVPISHDNPDSVLSDDEKLVIVDFPKGKLSIAQLQGLVRLMQSESIDNIYLINEHAFLFKCQIKGSAEPIKQTTQDLGLTLRTIL